MIDLPKDSEWTVVDGPFCEGRRRVWHCICNCGVESLVNDYDLRSGKSKKCRVCGSSKPWSDVGRRFVSIPRLIRKKIMHAVDNAIKRCTDPEHPRYHDWGGRGIKVRFDDRYGFFEYLITLYRYDDLSLVLDRTNNDKHYEVGNLQ